MIDFFGLKKKKIEKQNIEENTTGIIARTMPDMDRNGTWIYNIFLNGILNFMVVYSTIMLVINAFDIEMNTAAFSLILIIFCIFSASFYEFVFLKVIGYIAIVIGFIYGIIEYHSMIRGGFGTFANAFMEVIEQKLDLPIERRYQEYTANKTLAVTFCAVFIACSLALIFNMAISEAKGFALTFLITFPMVQLGMYFDRDISYGYFGIYISAMITLMLLRSSVHYKAETKKKRGYHVIEKKDVKRYEYVNDGGNSFTIMLFLIIAVICTFAVTYMTFGRNINVPEKYGQWKKSTQEFAKKTALVGFYGMLNKNGSGTGGIGRNRLGDVKYVKMDYQTDITVETQINKEEPVIYLKAYNGTYYGDNSWKYISEKRPDDYKALSEYGIKKSQIYSLSADILKNDIENRITNKVKKMNVYNMDANEDFIYYSNNALGILSVTDDARNDDELVVKFPQGQGIKFYYYPVKSMPYEELENQAVLIKENPHGASVYNVEEKYREYVANTYMDIPEGNINSIDAFIKKYDLRSEDGLSNVQKITDIFEKDFTYSLIPGATPDDEDFVNYFLDKTKKGYCSYFASSAVLILRRLGIPARYTGGYAVSTTDEEYMHKKNSYVTDLYQIDVNDSDAHAWVEVYINNLGWVNADVTPSDDETDKDEDTGVGFMQMLTYNIFNPDTAKTIKNTTISAFKIIVALFVSVIVVIVIAGVIIRHRRKYNIDIDKNVIYLRKMLPFAGIEWTGNMSYGELKAKMQNISIISDSDIDTFIEIVEKHKYSLYDVSTADRKKVHNIVLDIGQNIYDRITFLKKIYYIYVKCLIK